MRRVLVIGSGGAGKSTLALRVGEITGLPVIHLDRLYWGPGWAVPDREAWLRRLKDAMSADDWILDGNYSATLEIRLAASDTVLFLDFPPHVCIWRAVKRYLRYRGKARPDMAPGCDERLTLGFLHWIWTFRARQRDRLRRTVATRAGDANVIVFQSQKKIDRYVEKLAAERAG